MAHAFVILIISTLARPGRLRYFRNNRHFRKIFVQLGRPRGKEKDNGGGALLLLKHWVMVEQSHFLRHFLEAEADLRCFVGSFVRDRTAREDLFQDIAMTLWKTFAEYRDDRPFGAWARGIAMNKVRHYYGRSKRAGLLFSPQTMQAISDAFAKLERKSPAALDALEECVHALPEKSREILQMRYAESRDIDELSAFAGVSQTGIYKTLARLRKRLHDCIERRLLAHGESM
jgi:RNA polymerase sigma-70 factor, ECF subfamily